MTEEQCPLHSPNEPMRTSGSVVIETDDACLNLMRDSEDLQRIINDATARILEKFGPNLFHIHIRHVAEMSSDDRDLIAVCAHVRLGADEALRMMDELLDASRRREREADRVDVMLHVHPHRSDP